MKQSRFFEMANPEKDEKDEKDLGMGDALAASDGDDMSNVFIGANEHDILWIDAVTDASAIGNADFGDWTQTAAGDAVAQPSPDQWIASDTEPTNDDSLFEDGLVLTSIDGLPW
jgi:hypothetical protein